MADYPHHRHHGGQELMVGIMPSLARVLELDHPLYSEAELIEYRRDILRYARLFPPGPERNQHRQVALSLRVLFRNSAWLEAHVLTRG